MTSSATEGPGRGPQPDLNSNDPYAVLGLPRDAELRQVKRAYFRLVRDYPPEDAPEAFKRIRSAYEQLRTAETKAETDLFLFQPPYPWEPRKRRGRLDLDFDQQDVYRYLARSGDLGRKNFEDDYRPVKV